MTSELGVADTPHQDGQTRARTPQSHRLRKPQSGAPPLSAGWLHKGCGKKHAQVSLKGKCWSHGGSTAQTQVTDSSSHPAVSIFNGEIRPGQS